MNDESELKPSETQPASPRLPMNFLETERRGEERRRRRRRYAWFFCFLAMAVVAIFLIVRAIPDTEPDDIEQYDPVTLEPKAPEGFFRRLSHLVFHKEVTLAGEDDDRVNVLILGMGGVGHEGPYLTDTIIIASVKPSTGQVAMISIPRDLGVDIPDYGWYKINHANAFGESKRKLWGSAFASEVIEKQFDIPVHYYIRIDFKAFAEVIDEMGGIKVNVERGFVDVEYPTNNFRTTSISFKKGVQVMDGARALQYARSRHGNNGEGSDFARARRQQKMLLALKEKLTSFSTLTNPIRLKRIMDTLDAHITTNLTFSETLALIRLGRTLKTEEIRTVVLDSSEEGFLENGYTAAGAFVLAPKGGNFDAIRDAIALVFETTPTTVNDTPPQDSPGMVQANIEIQNGTWRAGFAARMKKTLVDKKFSVVAIGNTAERPLMTSAIYTVTAGAPEEVIQALKSELLITSVAALPAGLTVAPDTDILVVLGEDLTE